MSQLRSTIEQLILENQALRASPESPPLPVNFKSIFENEYFKLKDQQKQKDV
jgi:hypothetical protein